MNENPQAVHNPNLDQEPQKNFTESLLLNFLRHWNGRSGFSSALFGYFLLGNIVSLLLLAVMVRGTRFIAGNTVASHLSDTLIWVCVAYLIISIKIVWACVKNSTYPGFYYIVRSLIIVIIGIFVFSFLQVAYSYL